jgi:hypothetical protein
MIIHSQTLKELTEDELVLMWSIMDHLFVSKLGYSFKYEWLHMVKPDALDRIIRNSNLKEEYHGVRDSLIGKLKGGAV